MGVAENRKTARLLDDSFNRRDWGSFRGCFADDAIHNSVPEELGLGQGPDAVLEERLALGDLYADSDRVFTYEDGQAIHPARLST